MFRRLTAGLVVLVLVLVGILASPAQEKKDLPKQKDRIAIADPKEAATDPDFAIQGEYVGTITLNSGEKKVGAQVIAKGLGEFDVRVLMGGLPGEGWDGKTVVLNATAKRVEGGSAAITGPGASGTIGGGKLTIKDGMKIDTTLVRVERKSKTLGQKPMFPEQSLFVAPGDEKNWEKGKLLELSDGKFLTVAGTGSIRSQQKFEGFVAHIEFRTPWMPNSTGQQRGNSGVYLQDRYECQVLDSFGLSGENNECGGIYTQHKPIVNMCYPPLAWQTYDIEFTPAEFNKDGKKTKNARATIHHNGVKIHDDVEFPKECPGGQKEGPTAGPFQFQDHGDPVIYTNVWVVRRGM